MALDEKTIETLSGISTATFTTVLLKKGLRNVWLRGTRPLQPGARQDMILSPLFTAIVFLIATGLALGDWVRFAHLSLLMIVPVSFFFGSRTRNAQ